MEKSKYSYSIFHCMDYTSMNSGGMSAVGRTYGIVIAAAWFVPIELLLFFFTFANFV